MIEKAKEKDIKCEFCNKPSKKRRHLFCKIISYFIIKRLNKRCWF